MTYFIKNRKNGGYSLVELVFYIALFAVLSLTVINSMITMTKSFRETSIQSELTKGGDIMERMSREVRRATGISAISSNSLTLNTKDAGGIAETLQFVLSSNNVEFYTNGSLTGNLNTANVKVSSLAFSQITTTKGTAVKITLIIDSKIDTSRSETFYNTVVLRGDY